MGGETYTQLDILVSQGVSWLRQSALPLWGTQGVDAAGAFQEQLHFDGRPVESVPRRLMVQARQVATFAAASLSGDYAKGGALALVAGHRMCRCYHEADQAPGWVFSIDDGGRVIDPRRDLYGHAFVLFALAWILRLDRDPLFEARLESTLVAIDRLFADAKYGGYWDCIPRQDTLRRQNPHMHLFEALIALYETTGREDVMRRCGNVHQLAMTRFFDPASGALREYFDEAWNVSPSPGQGSVEPGHLFEWAWLLRKYEALSGISQTAEVQALIEMALKYGFDPASGRIVDAIDEKGLVRAASSRCWPHTEALKALSVEMSAGTPDLCSAMIQLMQRLFGVFCVSHLQGGWIDQFDDRDRPASRVMPASSLYHIYFGLNEVVTRLRPGAGFSTSPQASKSR